MSTPRAPEVEQALESFRRFLRGRSLPVTSQREQVAEVLFDAGAGHLSVEDVEGALRRRGIRVGKATIYRALDLLAECGMISERDFGEGFRRYERVPGHPHHEHLICVRCGTVVEFENAKLERLKAQIADEHGFRHAHHRLEIYGVCSECRRRDPVAQPAS